MSTLILQILVPFILGLLLLAGVLFVWRSWRERPWLAALVAALVVAVAPVLFRSKWLALLAIAAVLLALTTLGRRPKRRP